MDIESALKLAALGWNGKEDYFKFFYDNFGLSCKIQRNNLIVRYKINDTIYGISIKMNPERKILDYLLEFFHTDNGKIYGPDYKNKDKDWS